MMVNGRLYAYSPTSRGFLVQVPPPKLKDDSLSLQPIKKQMGGISMDFAGTAIAFANDICIPYDPTEPAALFS